MTMTTRTPELIAAEIKAWDMTDVRVLRDLISELKACRDEDGEMIDTEAYLDMTSLPSAEIPVEIDTNYPIWAVDNVGRALVGDDASEIETLEEVRQALA